MGIFGGGGIPYNSLRALLAAVAQSVGGGADAASVPVLQRFPIAYNTPGLANGVDLYTPTIGEIVLSAWIAVETPWNGTTPSGDIGLFSSGYNGLGFAPSTVFDMTHDSTWGGEVRQVPHAMYRAASTAPIGVAVTTTGLVAAQAFGSSIDLPLTVVAGVNDQLVITAGGGLGTPETFTVAPGTYSTLSAVRAALRAAVGSLHGEALSSIAAIGFTGGALALFMPGPASNGNTVSAGAHDLAATFFPSLPYTLGDPDGLAGPAPGATQGAASVYLLTATPAAT